ncbi:hypothetical protein L484_008806 [Morus notabilis]|uniref:Uncharacterized protein n=1 Tax=Morus notabilis TaxID=981085 RepID=W9RMW8_9ROSA|nr:hypothetical protein L484_008806 [Morus notabilis]
MGEMGLRSSTSYPNLQSKLNIVGDLPKCPRLTFDQDDVLRSRSREINETCRSANTPRVKTPV